MTGSVPRRFWTQANVRPAADGFAVHLDARPLRTPSGAPLAVPGRALAAAIAAEWDALDNEVRPERLPLTRAANTAIDRVRDNHAAVVAAVAEYGGTDLLCYRAPNPERLVARQAAGWDPWLGWAARKLAAPLVTVEGVMHRPQPEESLAALTAAVAAQDVFALTALHELVTLSGSLVLGLAVADGALDPSEAWELSRIDERWQAEQWGIDSEAEAAEMADRARFLDSHRLLVLLAEGDGLPSSRPLPSCS